MSDIKYIFMASGADSVTAAFASIEQAARKSAKGVEQAYNTQIRAARGAASAQEREAKRPVSRTEKLALQVAKDQERAESRASKARERSQLAAGKREIDNTRRINSEIAKAKAKASADVEKSERSHYDRVFRLADANKRRTIATAEQSARQNFQIEQRFRDKVKSERGARLGRIGGELKGAAIGTAATIGAIGLGLAGKATADAFGLQALANRISINSRKSGEKFVDQNTLRREFEATALASNGTVSALQVGEGAASFIAKTGRSDLARQFSGTFATTAAATGTDYSKVASAGAELATKFKIETVDEMQQALASITFGGKEGAFELSDAADKYAKLASAGATFGLDKGVKGVRTLQGLSQIAMSSTGSADVATSAVEAMFRQVVTNAGTLDKKFGVDVFTDKTRTKTRSIETLLPEILAATGGDKVALQKIFGDEGKRAINPLIDTFTAGYQGARGKGGKPATEAERIAAGKAAANVQLQSSINAPGSYADHQKDAAQASQNTGAKIAAQYERLQAAAADKLLPALSALLDRIEGSPEIIDALVGTLEALLDVIQGAVMTLQDMGIMKKREKSPEQIQRDERKKAKDAADQLATLPTLERATALAAANRPDEARAMLAASNDPATQAKAASLRAQIAVATKTADASANKQEMLQDIQTKDQFAAAYLAAGTNKGDMDQALAKRIGQAIVDNPAGPNTGGEGQSGYETKEQADIRNAFKQRTAEERGRFGGQADGGGAEVAADLLTPALRALAADLKAAGAAAKTLAEAGQANIITG